MPPAAYALASDTLIGVVRTSAAARQDAGVPLRALEASFLSAAAGVALWLLRLTVAPRSTAAGFRAWVVEECPVAPGRRAPRPPGPGRPADDPPPADKNSDIARTGAPDALPAPALASRPRRPSGGPRGGPTKTALFLALVTAEHGSLAAIPLASVARISAASAPRVGLNAGSARTALRRAVLTAQQKGDLP